MYLGFDIGIKNLAYCLIKKLDTPPTITNDVNVKTIDSNAKNILKLSGNYYQIMDWDVVNIMSQVNSYVHQRGELVLQQRPIVKCKAVIPHGSKAGRNGKKARSRPVSPAETHYCGKTALACLEDTPTYDSMVPAHKHGYQGYCGTHLKKSGLNKTEYLDAKLTNCMCCVMVSEKSSGAAIDVVPTKRCGTKAMHIDRKHYFRGYCKKHYNALIKDGIKKDTDFLKVIRGKKSTQMDLTHLGTALFEELSKRPHLYTDSTCVLLENQPVLTNPTMKSVQMFVHSFFIDYGIRNTLGNVKEIHCYSASKKLDLIKHVPTAVYESIKTEAKTIPKKYGRHKRIAIRLCENFLSPDSPIGIGCKELYNKFKSSKKKDDLADSLLMTLHYLERDELKKMGSGNALSPLLSDTKVMTENAPLVDSGESDSDISVKGNDDNTQTDNNIDNNIDDNADDDISSSDTSSADNANTSISIKRKSRKTKNSVII